MSDSEFEPKIVGFFCNWCSYLGADMAGTSRFTYPPNVRIIRVPCSGRVDPIFVLRSFQQGADGVWVSGCHPGDCHYDSGNFYARRRMLVLRELLDFLGIEPERLQMSFISAAEGRKCAELAAEITELIRKLGPLKLDDGDGDREGRGRAG